MHRLVISALRFGIALTVLLGLFGQIVVVPTTAADEVELFPPYEPYALPYAAAAIAGIACVQVACAAVWMLLGMVERDAIFTAAAFRWVDLVIGAAGAATLVALAASAHLTFATIPSPDDGMDVESALLGALACVAAGAAFCLLMVVMRSLLGKATGMRAELSAVV
ncbi:DUF2975 domain-containing protein [Streptomyces sp. NPDC005805]|uniref:DUF2975 domain-containing protein n=1 Tax=Streptomyces sp. NPDC005805 TaxID=3157068 RepID=UPI0033D527E9